MYKAGALTESEYDTCDSSENNPGWIGLRAELCGEQEATGADCDVYIDSKAEL